jgi:3-dehydroquinate dehydratase-2
LPAAGPALRRYFGFPFAGPFPITGPAPGDYPRQTKTAGPIHMSKTIYVLNGPNLNLLGQRQPEIYGRATLADVEKLCRATAKRHGLTVQFRQSNHEGVIVDSIQEARAKKAVGLIINPAGLTSTSIAILDALLTMEVPVIEVHITNIHAREEFRRNSYVSLAARALTCGFGVEGYALAINGLAAMIGAKV